MSTFDSGTGSASDLSSAPSGRATLPAPSCFRINEPSVIYQTFEQEVVAVHLNTGSYHTLPGIAGEAFLLLGPAGSSAQEAAVKLAARYDATPLLIEQDLDIFISQLLEQKMIVAIETAPGYVANAAPAQPKDAEQTPQLAPYTAPRLESFSDLEGLVLIDPVHDVDTTGWPKVAPDTLIESTDGGPGESAHAVVLPLMRCRLSGPNVIFERFNTETVAMDLGTGAYHSLAGEAEEIFLLFPSEPTTWEIRDALAGKYLVEMSELEAALAEYLNQLVQEGLILLEKIEGEVTPRDLQLTETPGDAAERKPFHHPRIEAFAQPSFDGGFGEEMTFSHERSAPKEDPAEGTASPDPYTRRRYAVRSGDLVYSTAGGETVIADRDQGQYFKLNRAASDVFALLERRPDAAGSSPRSAAGTPSASRTCASPS